MPLPWNGVGSHLSSNPDVASAEDGLPPDRSEEAKHRKGPRMAGYYMGYNHMKRLTSFKFGTATVALGVAIAASPVLAQGQPTEETLEEVNDAPPSNAIVVTGSRIASPTVESPAPLQIVDSQVINDAGVTNIQEVLLENPVFGTPALSRTNSAFLTSGTGVATVDLRDLGSDRTPGCWQSRRFGDCRPQRHSNSIHRACRYSDWGCVVTVRFRRNRRRCELRLQDRFRRYRSECAIWLHRTG